MTMTPDVKVRRRREEGIPILIKKFESNLKTQFSEQRTKEILDLCMDEEKLRATVVSDFMSLIKAEGPT